MGAVGFSLLFASILTVMFKNLTNNSVRSTFAIIIPIILLVSWLSINFVEANSYLTNLEVNRNLDLANRTWDSLRKSVPRLGQDAPSVFYFTSDNSTAANMVLVFGFWPHAGLEYNISNWENTPLPAEDYKQLLEMVQTGKPLKNIHGRKEEPVPLSRVFAFDFKNGELINITDKIRQQLSLDLNLQKP